MFSYPRTLASRSSWALLIYEDVSCLEIQDLRQRLHKSISILLYFWCFSSNDREIHLLGKLLRLFSAIFPF